MNKGLFKIITFLFFGISTLMAQQNSFTNPILPGAYPDPSICRVNDTFYIVNSSFEYFPGIPIHKSQDLVNWELIGYGLHRKEQCQNEVNLIDVQSDGGIHAPTIRFHKGTFYIITTNVYYNESTKTTDFVNFIITANRPEGPWSSPHILKGAPGIDPDIFFDDDGKVWYVGTHSPENPNFQGEGEIWLQEIDLDNWELIGPRSFLWRGACGGVWVEGPHVYKKDNRYYLMVAEGGTSFNHAVMIAVSDSIEGPYIANDRNPILSSRQLSYDNWVHSTGHGDLIELKDGRWYMVTLGIRGDEERASNMGRETHLVPVEWEREPYWWKEPKYEWPVVAPRTGKVERNMAPPFDNTHQIKDFLFVDSFHSEVLDLQWNFRRVPTQKMFALNAAEGYLRLFCLPQVIENKKSASLLGFRQTESDFEYLAKMDFNPKSNYSEAGISIFQKDDHYINLTVIKRENKYFLELKYAEPNKAPLIIFSKNISDFKHEITFKINSNSTGYSFYYSLDGENFQLLRNSKSNILLSKYYTGAYLGVYASSNGHTTNDFADFHWVSFKAYQRP